MLGPAATNFGPTLEYRKIQPSSIQFHSSENPTKTADQQATTSIGIGSLVSKAGIRFKKKNRVKKLGVLLNHIP